MKHIVFAIVLSLAGTAALAADFTVSFNWDGLKRCTSGRPNTVGNPVFTLSAVPAGTKWLYFKLTDIDVPNYNHGGGWIQYNGGNVTAANIFKYKSPCPPNGRHTYEWSVRATASKDSNAGLLGAAALRMKYPN